MRALFLAFVVALGGCDEPAPAVRAEPSAVATAVMAVPSASGSPVDGHAEGEEESFYAQDDGCEALSPPSQPVDFRMRRMSLDELVEALPPILGGCIDASPGLLHHYRCLHLDERLQAPNGADALDALQRILARYDLRVEPQGGRFRLEAPLDGGPCPDGG